MSDEDEASSTAGPVSEGSELTYGAGDHWWLALNSLIALTALVLAGVALVVAGTSDDDDGGGGASAPREPMSEVTIVGTEFSFDPDDPLVFADTDVGITFSNEGAVVHNLNVLASGVDYSEDIELSESDVVARVDDIEGGAEASTTVALPTGTYQMVCTIPGHFDLGMSGVLEVTAS